MYHKSTKEKELLLALFGQVYDNPFWSLGEKTKEAEGLCNSLIFRGTKESLLVNDGTHALELCLRDIGVQGKHVLLPVLTVPMVAWAVTRAGGIPVFVDVDFSHQMDADKLKKAYDLHKDSVGAVILVHTGGLISPDIEEIVDFCKERSLPFIEDISHAQLSYYVKEGKFFDAGTFGDYAAFSMYATKVVSTGEGGFAAKRGDITGMKAIRNQGKNENQEFVREGYNFRASEWTACVAIAKLSFINKELDHRKQMASLYEQAGFKGLHQSPLLYKGMTMHPSFYKYILSIGQGYEESLTYRSGAVHRDLLDTLNKDNYPGAKRAARKHVCLTLESEEKVRQTIKELEGMK